ncbi:MAG: EAL domain-containing protein [Burkholderiales bacterium]|nr:EAL domain-containing protein [Burkholderiales bacterium]
MKLLERFFTEAQATYPSSQTILTEEFAQLPGIHPTSHTPALMAQYLLAAGKLLPMQNQLAGELLLLCDITPAEISEPLVMACISIALAKTTTLAFAQQRDDIAQCAAIVATLQKFFFFQAGLLGEFFSNGGSRHAGEPNKIARLPGNQVTVASLAELLNNRRETKIPLAVLVAHIAFSHLAMEGGAYAESKVFTAAADRLRQALRDTDIVGRFSGDEFLIVLPHASGAGLAALAANKLIKALAAPLDVAGRHAIGRLTLGISLFPEHGSEVETLLHHAQIAREVAWQSKNPYAVYDKEFHRQNRLRKSLEAMLRNALQENELEVYLQPQADLHTGRIASAESLLRWRLPDDSMVSPAQIISIAEESDLISALTMWIVNSTLRHLSALIKAGINITVSVNVTPSNLLDPELPDFIAQALSTWNVPASKLVIELTETAMIGDSERTIGTLHQLKSMGLTLSIDDFGTGYSCLAYLKRMPLDELKVDQIFVQNMLKARDDERIVRSIIDLARHFDLKVVAEGVEDLSTLEFLRTLGCDGAQGYFISQPLSTGQFTDWWLARKGLLIRTDSTAPRVI